MADTRSRKWQITINNPKEKGITSEKIKEILEDFKSFQFGCWCDEIGEKGTYHTHIFMCCMNAVRFSTMSERFEGAHLEMAKGTCQQNLDYVRKEGKWEKSEKKETNLIETYEELGEMPLERPGARNDIADLYSMIKQGMTDYEILEEDSRYMLQMDKITKARQILREQEFKDTWRDLEVVYVFGDTGTGKTRDIMDRYGYSNVYRISNYDNPFDGYNGQDVILFDEFRSQIKLSQMLMYLDGYPVSLPCRYSDKVACFTKVYVVSNVDIDSQYRYVQENEPESWRAFKRRIHRVQVYTNQIGMIEYRDMAEYDSLLGKTIRQHNSISKELYLHHKKLTQSIN